MNARTMIKELLDGYKNNEFDLTDRQLQFLTEQQDALSDMDKAVPVLVFDEIERIHRTKI